MKLKQIKVKDIKDYNYHLKESIAWKAFSGTLFVLSSFI